MLTVVDPGVRVLAAPDRQSGGAVCLEAASPASKEAKLRAQPRKEDTGPLSPGEQARFEEVVEEITPLGDIAKHQDELADLGIIIVSTSNGEQPWAARTSTRDDLNIPRPEVLWDTSNQRYYAYASYRWIAANTEDHYYDIGNFSGACVDTPCNIGGNDGFGIRFSRNMQNVSVSSIFCGRDLSGVRDWADFDCTTPNNPDDNSSRGVTWRKQDKIYKTVVKPDNNMFIGSTSMVIKKPSCGAPLQIFSQYNHSWNDTNLTGFSAGPDGFGVSWSGGSDSWRATSQSGTWDIWDAC